MRSSSLSQLRRRRPSRLCSLHFVHFSTPITSEPTANSFLNHNEDNQETEEEGSISNRAHWSRRIHMLCSNNVDDALRLLDNLRLRGYRPDSLNLASIIHSLCNFNRFHEAHQRLLLSLATNWVPDERTSNVLLARLLDVQIPNLTLQVFRRLVAMKPGFVPSITNYNRLIASFCHVLSDPSSGYQLLVEMKSVGQFPNSVSYTTLIDGFGRIGELMAAQQVFDQMLKCGILPNSLTYSALIKGFLRCRRVDEGRKLMHLLWMKMAEEEDRSVINAAFANLIDALCREGFAHEVFRIAEEMPQGKCVNEGFVYGQIIDSLCRSGRNHGASRIIYIMRRRGFVPSMVSYNCIVHNLSKEGEGGCMRAYQLLKEGMEFRYSPSESTYKVLVEGLCRELDVSKAKEVVEFMLSQNQIDKTRIYNIFVSALRLVNEPSEQLNVLVSMLQNQCSPDIVTLNTVIHGFCKMGKISEAMKILDDMLSGKFCYPDVVTFTIVTSGLLDAGNIEEALLLLHNKMSRYNCRPTIVTYNTVLRGLCKLHQVDKAIEVFDEMVAKGVASNSMAFATIIGGLMQAEQVVEAKKFWENVIWPSKVHDDFVYAAILRGLCNIGKLSEACDFLYELVDCGVSPGLVNYNILIDAASKLGLKREAYQVVAEMRKNGLTPDAVTWRILDKLHGNGKKDHTFSSGSLESNLIPVEDTWRILDKLHGNGKKDHTFSSGSLESNLIPVEDTGARKEQDVGGEEKREDMKVRTCNLHAYRKSKVREPLSSIARRAFGLM